MKALNAAVEPKYITPRMICTAMLSIMAFSGICRRLLIFLHHCDPGMAPSRAKAHVQRDAAVVHPMPQIMARTMMGIKSANVPPELPTADFTIIGTGWSEDWLMRDARSGRMTTSGMRKMSPARVLSTIVPTMAFGTWVRGLWTSSHILL